MKKTFKILSLDVWGNSEDGFEVNDVRNLSSITLDLAASDSELKKAVFKHLEDEGLVIFHAPYNVASAAKASELKFEDDNFAEILDKSDNMPLYHLICEDF
jgi:hypothetical protein